MHTATFGEVGSRSEAAGSLTGRCGPNPVQNLLGAPWLCLLRRKAWHAALWPSHTAPTRFIDTRHGPVSLTRSEIIWYPSWSPMNVGSQSLIAVAVELREGSIDATTAHTAHTAHMNV